MLETRRTERVPRALSVCMLVYNNCTTDARVLKEAHSLVEQGHRVWIIAVLDRSTVPLEYRDGLVIERVDRRPLHYRLLWRSRAVRRRLRLARARWQRRARAAKRKILRGWHRVQAQLSRMAPKRRARKRLVTRRERPAALDPRVVSRPPRRTAVGEMLIAPLAPARRASSRLYGAARWRALRLMPWLRRPSRALVVALTRRSRAAARRRARWRLEDERWYRADPASRQSAARQARIAQLHARSGASRAVLILTAPVRVLLGLPFVLVALTLRSGWAGASRAVSWTERRVSRVAYRAVMSLHKPLMFTDWYVRTYRLVAASGADVVHAHDLNTLPAAVALGRRLHTPVVYDSHELYPEVSTLSARERRVWRFLERRLIRRTTRVLTVCESIAEELTRRYPIERPAILLNCPEAAASVLPVRDGRLRAAAGLADDIPVVLYQGGYAPYRGLNNLITAARHLEGCALVLMGWGRLEDDLRRMVIELNLQERVRMIPPASQSELLAWTREADIGVIPYQPVGLNNLYSTPNKLFEYMAAGLAIAGSRLPELSRFIDGHGLGVTFDPADPEGIALAVNSLLEDRVALDKMRERSLAAADLYAWETQVTVLNDLYCSFSTQANAADSLSTLQS